MQNKNDTIYRQDAINAVSYECHELRGVFGRCEDALKALPPAQSETCAYWDSESNFCALHRPSAQSEQRWIPVTLETLPNLNSVVVVCGKGGTWDYGTYRGWHGDIHSWNWKKNTIKHVYWWMYKADALPEPYREERG